MKSLLAHHMDSCSLSCHHHERLIRSPSMNPAKKLPKLLLLVVAVTLTLAACTVMM